MKLPIKKLKEIQTKKNYSGEASPYRDWLDRKGDYNQEHQANENPEANPDVVSEEHGLYYQLSNEETEAKAQFFKDHFHDLSKQERTVMELHGIAGMALSQIAKILKVKKGTVSTLLGRARKKLQKLSYLSSKTDI